MSRCEQDVEIGSVTGTDQNVEVDKGRPGGLCRHITDTPVALALAFCSLASLVHGNARIGSFSSIVRFENIHQKCQATTLNQSGR